LLAIRHRDRTGLLAKSIAGRAATISAMPETLLATADELIN